MLDLAVVKLSYCTDISYVWSVNSFEKGNDKTLTREKCKYIWKSSSTSWLEVSNNLVKTRFAFYSLYKPLTSYKPLTILTDCQNPFLIVLCIIFSFVVLLFSFSLLLTFLSICFVNSYQNNFKVFNLLWVGS